MVWGGVPRSHVSMFVELGILYIAIRRGVMNRMSGGVVDGTPNIKDIEKEGMGCLLVLGGERKNDFDMWE